MLNSTRILRVFMLQSLTRRTSQTIIFVDIARIRHFNTMNPVQESMKAKLKAHLETKYIEVINESYMHNVPKGSETHFKVVVVSEKFNNKPLLQRHRMVNEILKEELQNGVHALSIETKTPSQWKENDVIKSSPSCRGGFGR